MADDNLTDGIVISKIYFYRGHKVMLDADLAELYEVETRQLNQQVGRNPERFPGDFMFQLTDEEFADVKSRGDATTWGGRRYPPYAFTEHGVLMLSSVLRSARAVAVNIQITRVFTRMRELLINHKDLVLKVEQMDGELRSQGEDIATIYRYVKELIEEPAPQRRRIGYRRTGEEGGS